MLLTVKAYEKLNPGKLISLFAERVFIFTLIEDNLTVTILHNMKVVCLRKLLINADKYIVRKKRCKICVNPHIAVFAYAGNVLFADTFFRKGSTERIHVLVKFRVCFFAYFFIFVLKHIGNLIA